MDRGGRVWAGTDYWPTIREGGGVAQTSGGFTHIVDFTDPMNPRQVARYHVDEFGSHDIIVQGDTLYQALYDGGVRVVDVSGELLGNLYDQGCEIGVFRPFDPQGRTANAPFVMNAMPWKGHTLFTDFNSGLWAIKLVPKGGAVVTEGRRAGATILAGRSSDACSGRASLAELAAVLTPTSRSACTVGLSASFYRRRSPSWVHAPRGRNNPRPRAPRGTRTSR